MPKYNAEIQNRPWGSFQVLLSQQQYLIKKIIISPNARISLQYHLHREETWIITKGSGVLELGEKQDKFPLKVGDVISIEPKELHRMTATNQGVEFVEIQHGQILSEEDIVRIQDDYGRVNQETPSVCIKCKEKDS